MYIDTCLNSHFIGYHFYLFSGLNSRQNYILLVIIILCIIICIGLYFISVSNDYNELQSFYYAFLERKSLIYEGRMAHRQDLERMAPNVVSFDVERLHCCYCFVLTHQIFEGCWFTSPAGQWQYKVGRENDDNNSADIGICMQTTTCSLDLSSLASWMSQRMTTSWWGHSGPASTWANMSSAS